MKAFGIIAAILVVGIGVYLYQQHRLSMAANNGDTISPDNSVTTSLAAPDPVPASVPAKSTMPGSTAVSTPAATPVSTPSRSVTSTRTSLNSDSSAVPTSDSIDRNPPNGMVFAGTGHIQVYRQGNITWRINTDNGDACVLFATDREWRKPRVYSAGCRKS